MTLKGKFIQEDTLRNRKRLGSLAWILIFIVVLFLLACVLGAFLLVTRNVSPLLPVPASPTQIAGNVTLTVSSITVTPTIQTSQVITWTVSPAKNPLGQTIYDGPPEIKAWVMRDYQAAQKWKMDHLFDRDYLLTHLAEYFTDKALEKERRDIEDSFDGSLKVISAPLAFQSHLPSPMDKPVFNAFSADGMQMNLSDFNGPSWKFYDTRTRKLIAAQVHRGTWGYTLEYAAQAKRWKVARLTMKYDLDDDQPTYADELFRIIR
ncbi:MAG: hypothetical protein HZB51_22740 [Chloroflexi bacterium]|nr:hypothetical protein [Chloroflexota bacterium]